LGGGLSAQCGVNAGANMCTTPVDATAAPFRVYNEERGLPAGEPAIRQHPETPVHILKAGACGAAGLTADAGGKDCLRSAAPLVGQAQQAPTANSEALTFPPVVEPPGG